jgi:hypothetical protein
MQQDKWHGIRFVREQSNEVNPVFNFTVDYRYSIMRKRVDMFFVLSPVNFNA